MVARAAGLLAEAGVDFRQERWWPRQFGRQFTEMLPDLCQAGVPVSPLVFACGVDSIRCVNGMVAALRQMDQHRWTQWVSAPAGPRGDEAPTVALLYGRFQILRDLLDAKATLTPNQHALALKASRLSGHGADMQVRPKAVQSQV